MDHGRFVERCIHVQQCWWFDGIVVPWNHGEEKPSKAKADSEVLEVHRMLGEAAQHRSALLLMQSGSIREKGFKILQALTMRSVWPTRILPLPYGEWLEAPMRTWGGDRGRFADEDAPDSGVSKATAVEASQLTGDEGKLRVPRCLH